jgi:2'-5' RNA ligase
MQAIASLLDKENDIYIRSIWRELETEFGLKIQINKPLPHFSYLVSPEVMNLEIVSPILKKIASDQADFKVRAHGLGIFRVPKKVFFIPVVRNHELAMLQNELWSDLSESGIPISAMYSPHTWIPHLTLGITESFPENLGEIIYYLCHKDFDLELHIDNFALINTEADDEKTEIFKFCIE